jgi:hypothetical protein
MINLMKNENDYTIIGITEAIHNINIQKDLNVKENLYPNHPDLIEKNILAYRHY